MSDKKISKKAKYTAVIIGAGRIAASFDTPKNKEILTYAHAYRKHPKTELVGFFDINQLVAKRAARQWSCQSFADIDQMLHTVRPAIVSICTPDAAHLLMLEKVASYEPKLVICEKPVTLQAATTKRVIALYQKKKIPLLINYSRRFDTSMQALRDQLMKGEFGQIIGATGIYAKGLLHNGSHLVDLARFLFGEVVLATPLYQLVDDKAHQPTVAGFLRLIHCPQFHLVVADERCYGVFELDILAERGRIRLTDYGFTMSIQRIQEDQRYKEFFVAGKPKTRATQLPQAMRYLVDNAVEHLEERSALLCSGREALKTQQACELLI